MQAQSKGLIGSINLNPCFNVLLFALSLPASSRHLLYFEFNSFHQSASPAKQFLYGITVSALVEYDMCLQWMLLNKYRMYGCVRYTLGYNTYL